MEAGELNSSLKSKFRSLENILSRWLFTTFSTKFSFFGVYVMKRFVKGLYFSVFFLINL